VIDPLPAMHDRDLGVPPGKDLRDVDEIRSLAWPCWEREVAPQETLQRFAQKLNLPAIAKEGGVPRIGGPVRNTIRLGRVGSMWKPISGAPDPALVAGQPRSLSHSWGGSDRGAIT